MAKKPKKAKSTKKRKAKKPYQSGVPTPEGPSVGAAPSQEEFELCGLDTEHFIGKRVLDVACNTGFFSFKAAELGAAHVYGFDEDSVAISGAVYAQGQLNVDIDIVHFWNYEFAEVPWDALPKFDTVLAMSCLYHISRKNDIGRVLDTLCSACTETLVAYTKVFKVPTDPATLGEGWEGLYVPTPKEFSRELIERGFKTVEVRGRLEEDCGKLGFVARR